MRNEGTTVENYRITENLQRKCIKMAECSYRNDHIVHAYHWNGKISKDKVFRLLVPNNNI